MKKKALGRGLDALLPDREETKEESIIRDIDVNEIDPNRKQPRQEFNEDKINELAKSILNNGILSPIIVIKNGERYKIVAGERRYRAARINNMSTVPCIVREMDESQRLEVALIENIQREDLNPMEAASAIKDLMTKCNYTQDEVSGKLGKSRSSIANLLRILTLPDAVTDLVRNGKLSFGHARVLAGLEDRNFQLLLAQKCVVENLSVHQLEKETAKNKPKNKIKAVKKIDPELQAFENNLRVKLGMKTKVEGNQNKGKIVLSYSSQDELNKFYELMEQLL